MSAASTVHGFHVFIDESSPSARVRAVAERVVNVISRSIITAYVHAEAMMPSCYFVRGSSVYLVILATCRPCERKAETHC